MSDVSYLSGEYDVILTVIAGAGTPAKVLGSNPRRAVVIFGSTAGSAFPISIQSFTTALTGAYMISTALPPLVFTSCLHGPMPGREFYAIIPAGANLSITEVVQIPKG